MQTFSRDFRDGLRAFGEALLIIRQHKLWGYVLLPGGLSLIFGAGIAFLAYSVSGNFSDWITDKYPWEFGAGFVRKISGFLGSAVIIAGAVLAYKYVILILVAPFMSPLSEKVESYIRGEGAISVPFSMSRVLRELVRGIRIGLRNIFREIFLTLLLLMAGGIPLIGLLSGPAMFAVQSYFAGFGNMDYTLERHMGVRGSVEFVRDYRGLAVANGMVFLLLLMIPVAGLFLAPSLATVAATVETVERLDFEAAS